MKEEEEEKIIDFTYQDHDHDYNQNQPEESITFIKPNPTSTQLINSKSHLYYMDAIVEQFKSSKYHTATLFVCIFSMLLAGYSTSHYIFNKNLLIQQYSWTITQYTLIFVIQNIICATGAFASVTSTTIEWDIHSNSLVGFISCSGLVILHFFGESPSFIFLTTVFYFCQGFINNICCNFLLEEYKIKYRELAFLFVSSFRLIGCGLFGLIGYISFDVYLIRDPLISIAGLTILQFGLSISLTFFYESPRLLFCNNQLDLLFDYIGVAVSPEINNHRKNIMNHLTIAKREFDIECDNQEYENIFKNFYELWIGRHLKLSLKSIVFVFLATFLMSNIKDTFSLFAKGSNETKYLFLIVEESKPHSKIIYYYMAVYLLVIVLIGMKYLLNISRRILVMGSLVFCFIWLMCLLLVPDYFIYFLALFEGFAFFYFMMIYMYFSTYTTTKLRNSMTSLMFITFSIALIFQCVLVVTIENHLVFSYMNFINIFLLIILDFVLIHDDTKDLKLQEIEVKILSKEKDKESKNS